MEIILSILGVILFGVLIIGAFWGENEASKQRADQIRSMESWNRFMSAKIDREIEQAKREGNK